MNIIHQGLQVDGVELQRIQDLTIRHRPNQYAFAKLTGEADRAAMESFMDRSAETLITITVGTMSGAGKKIFCGYILRIDLEEKADYCLAKMLLADTSYRLDLQRERKSFQNLARTYGEILTEACQQNGLGDTAQVAMNVPDKPIGEFVLQLDETDWAFARRMASRFAAPVITDCTAEKPYLSVGLLPRADQENALVRAEYSVRYQDGKRQFCEENSLLGGRQSMAEDFASFTVEADVYLPLGAKVSFRGKSYYIAAVWGKLQDGMLHMRYRLAAETAFLAPRQKNPACAGLVLIGRVEEVGQDKVKVYFVDVDDRYDEGTTKWFTYSTTYSSSDGSGWYVMPDEGDYVRVFFPTQEEKDAFCVSTVNAAPPANTRNKTLRAPGGKELLLTDDSVHLITKHQDTFVDMSGTGINIVTSNTVNVRADKNVLLQGKKIEFLAERGISLQANGTIIDMSAKELKLAAEDVVIGGV